MKFKIEKKYLQIGLIAFTVIAAAICFYYLIFHGDRFAVRLKEFFTVLSPVIYGIVTAYLLTPLVNAIERSVLTALWGRNGKPITSKGKKQMRALSIFLSICIAVLLIYAFFSILIPNILRSIRSISIQFPYYIRNLTNWSNKFLEDNPDIEKLFVQFLDTYSEEFTNYVNNTIVPKMETIVRQVSLSMISLVKILWNFLIGFIIAIYLLFSKENFAAQCKKVTYAVLSQKAANQFIKDIRFTSDTFIGFISGKIVDSAIIGVICFAGTSVMKMPYALLVSVIVGVTNVIPFFGPYMGAIPSAILILMVNPMKCIYFVIFIIILQQIDGNFIGPKILGQSTGLSSFWVIFSITLFGGLWGVLGMIVGVPLFAVIYAFARRIINRFLSKKGLSSKTKDYKRLDYIDPAGAFIELPAGNNQKSFFKLGKKSPGAKEEEQEPEQSASRTEKTEQLPKTEEKEGEQ